MIKCFLGTVFFLTVMYLPQPSFANAAQPGIWNAGGTVFTMLYPSDSATFKKVQMVEEKIYIQLYKGYAVVKGTYLFRNTTQEKLDFKMGYPVNGIYYGGDIDLNEVILDSLSCFKIKAKSNWLPLIKEPHPQLHHDGKNPIPYSDNWMAWQMAFKPLESQIVEVYFIVNTNAARIRSGYDSEEKNALIYLLESGSVWHLPIKKGTFYIQLMDDLSTKDVAGISQNFGFMYNYKNNLFMGERINISPTPKDNLIITYNQYNKIFDFNKVITNAERLFNKIDALSHMSFNTLNYSSVNLADPYQVKGSFWGIFPGLIMLFIIYAPFLIGIITVFIFIWAIVRWIKIRRNKK